MKQGRGPRQVARRVLERALDPRTRAYASLALAGELDRAGLSVEDRALATELAYGVLRQRDRLDRALSARATRGRLPRDLATQVALECAAYQLLFLRVPPYAAIDEAVEAVKRARGERQAGFANALLRKLAAEGEPPLPTGDDLASLSIRAAVPEWIAARVRAAVGDEAERALAALLEPAPTWLRANPPRADRAALERTIAGERPRAQLAPSPLSDEALAVRQGGDVSSTRAFAEGLFAVQDLGAQLVSRLAAPRSGARILDACAGVGGKSTHLARLAGPDARIDAADLSPRKLELARDLAARLGVANLRTVAHDLTDPAAPLAASYDLVVLDAPCSGLGVLRRHPEIKHQRSEAELAELASLQALLLAALAPRVAPGGALVYSVCTFSDEEGPRQVERFLRADDRFRLGKASGALAAAAHSDGSLRTWPHRHDADAFYAARLDRRA
jgi:16S rRNA (cytosine967-C5)-methyltransferase